MPWRSPRVPRRPRRGRRSKRYRYYTCFSRSRYGTAGCTAPRLPADELDTAVLKAMCDFYAQADSLLADAVTRAHQHHRESDADRRAEHDTIDTQISATEATITRYHAAFENGTMDDATAGPRIRALRTQLDQLTARRDDLTDLADLADDEPARPSPETLDRLRGYLSRMLTEDSSIERKSAIEARRSSGG